MRARPRCGVKEETDSYTALETVNGLSAVVGRVYNFA